MLEILSKICHNFNSRHLTYLVISQNPTIGHNFDDFSFGGHQIQSKSTIQILINKCMFVIFFMLRFLNHNQDEDLPLHDNLLNRSDGN